ncbi:MAG: peptidoglycan recognition family protein, partial [Planctomycetota bacterium]
DADGNPWLGIGYHFLIGNGHGMPDGAIEPTFRWDRQLAGAHAGDATMNKHAIGVALVGNFESRPPTARQTEALVALLQTLATEHGLGPGDLITHADVRPTLCPGRHFPLAAIRDAVASGETTESPR